MCAYFRIQLRVISSDSRRILGHLPQPDPKSIPRPRLGIPPPTLLRPQNRRRLLRQPPSTLALPPRVQPYQGPPVRRPGEVVRPGSPRPEQPVVRLQQGLQSGQVRTVRERRRVRSQPRRSEEVRRVLECRWRVPERRCFRRDGAECCWGEADVQCPFRDAFGNVADVQSSVFVRGPSRESRATERVSGDGEKGVWRVFQGRHVR